MAVDLPTLITWLRAVRATGEHPEDQAATGVIWPLFSVRALQGRYLLNQAGERVLELADALERAHAERDALHDRAEAALSAALGEPGVDAAPTLEDLIAQVPRLLQARERVDRREDGTLWRTLDGAAYLSADEGLTWLRVPNCGFEGCARPATRVEDDGGVGFCDECGARWGVAHHHVRDNPFAPLWRRRAVALDHGGALAAAWSSAGEGEAPETEPLDTRWPEELRQQIAGLEGTVGAAREQLSELLPIADAYQHMATRAVRAEAERDELRLTLAAERGEQAGAPSARWADNPWVFVYGFTCSRRTP